MDMVHVVGEHINYTMLMVVIIFIIGIMWIVADSSKK